MASVFFAGCNETKHYRTLSFFFDGVPVPEHLRGEVELHEDDPRREMAPQPAEVISYIYHAPYANRSCFGCHRRDQAFETAATDAALCQNCHDGYFKVEADDWVHGPIAVGECSYCHEPHRSVHEHLLTDQPRDLCFQCHDQQQVETEPFHAEHTDRDCGDCHDPHSAGNRRLLVDSRSYRRRARTGVVNVSAHPEWERTDCAMCHIAAESNRLVDNVDAQCLTCHGSLTEANDGQLHTAVAEGHCTACHTPHKSQREHLVHSTAEQMCLTCHSLEEIQTPTHPTVTRVDCLLCHGGHRTERDMLLRPHVPGGGAMQAPPDATAAGGLP